MATSNFFTSSIGKKIIMGLTGLFLISFLVVHVSINATILLNDGGATFNAAAHFMSTNPVIRVMEIGLFVGLIAHIVQGILLTLENKKRRPVAYAVVDGNANSKWYSRSMGLLGTLLLLFLILHLYHFWVPTKQAVFSGTEHDTFLGIKEVFANPINVVIYIAGVASLLFHLLHGFSSAFQTFGLTTHRYKASIKSIGVAFSILIPLLFAAMPVYLHIIGNSGH